MIWYYEIWVSMFQKISSFYCMDRGSILLSFVAKDIISEFLVVVVSNLDTSKAENRVCVESDPSCSLIARAKQKLRKEDQQLG